MEISPIAFARNGYSSKFGIPRQSGRADSVLTRIVFTEPYRQAEALRSIEQWSYLWLIWGFSENTTWSPTVRPPRLGGNSRVGVFATRSPFRPNALGLSSVKLIKVEQTASEGTVLLVSGADLMDRTPIYDIKPYLPYTDAHADATNGFARNTDYGVEVCFAQGTTDGIDPSVLRQLHDILKEDPRPAYHDDPQRDYRFEYGGYHIVFSVSQGVLTVKKIEKTK